MITIDDYYRLQEVPSTAEPSYADKVNAPLSDATVVALNAELASGDYARFRKSRGDEAP